MLFLSRIHKNFLFFLFLSSLHLLPANKFSYRWIIVPPIIGVAFFFATKKILKQLQLLDEKKKQKRDALLEEFNKYLPFVKKTYFPITIEDNFAESIKNLSYIGKSFQKPQKVTIKIKNPKIINFFDNYNDRLKDNLFVEKIREKCEQLKNNIAISNAIKHLQNFELKDNLFVEKIRATCEQFKNNQKNNIYDISITIKYLRDFEHFVNFLPYIPLYAFYIDTLQYSKIYYDPSQKKFKINIIGSIFFKVASDNDNSNAFSHIIIPIENDIKNFILINDASFEIKNKQSKFKQLAFSCEKHNSITTDVINFIPKAANVVRNNTRLTISDLENISIVSTDTNIENDNTISVDSTSLNDRFKKKLYFPIEKGKVSSWLSSEKKITIN